VPSTISYTAVTEVVLQANDRIRAGQTIVIFETEKSKGVGTVINEMSAGGKGYKTLLGEIRKPSANGRSHGGVSVLISNRRNAHATHGTITAAMIASTNVPAPTIAIGNWPTAR
jgi:hypothetical protein